MAPLRRIVHYAKVLGPSAVLASAWGKLSGRLIVMSFRDAAAAHPIHMRFPSSDADAYEQIFLHHEYAFDIAQPPSVIVDAGANIGMASIFFANKYPGAKVFAIECEASNFRVLGRNVAPYANIVPIHAALWSSDGEVDIVDPGLGHWGFMTSAASASSGKATRVRALTLDSIMREHGIEKIDILKMDIEGAEKEVLDASSGWIGKVDVLIAELHDRLKSGCESSFAQATTAFANRWQRGENMYVSRGGAQAATAEVAAPSQPRP